MSEAAVLRAFALGGCILIGSAIPGAVLGLAASIARRLRRGRTANNIILGEAKRIPLK